MYIGILAVAMELVLCVEILLFCSVEVYWSTYGVIYMQL